MIGRHDRKARENRDAILSALIAQVEREGIIHARQLCNLSDLVDALSAGDAAIDFLQAHQIGTLGVDDGGDARQIKFLVHADADMDVVSHHPQLLPACGNRRQR